MALTRLYILIYGYYAPNQNKEYIHTYKTITSKTYICIAGGNANGFESKIHKRCRQKHFEINFFLDETETLFNLFKWNNISAKYILCLISSSNMQFSIFQNIKCVCVCFFFWPVIGQKFNKLQFIVGIV